MADSRYRINGNDPKRPTVSEEHFESLAERRIREAQAAGEFDDLPGEGKPIPGAGTKDDELWWLRSFFKRERQRET